MNKRIKRIIILCPMIILISVFIWFFIWIAMENISVHTACGIVYYRINWVIHKNDLYKISTYFEELSKNTDKTTTYDYSVFSDKLEIESDNNNTEQLIPADILELMKKSSLKKAFCVKKENDFWITYTFDYSAPIQLSYVYNAEKRLSDDVEAARYGYIVCENDWCIIYGRDQSKEWDDYT